MFLHVSTVLRTKNIITELFIISDLESLWKNSEPSYIFLNH